MKNLIWVFLLLSLNAFSEENNKKFQVLNEHKIYTLVDGFFIDQSFMNKKSIAESIIHQNKKLNCQFLPKSNHNPSSVLCWKLLAGEVIIGQDPSGNESSFCFFKDGSSITTDSLLKLCEKSK